MIEDAIAQGGATAAGVAVALLFVRDYLTQINTNLKDLTAAIYEFMRRAGGGGLQGGGGVAV